MRFLIDAQLPPALARWLEAQGHEAVHVCDADMGSAPDDQIWTYAHANSFVIVSKDEDFARRRVLADQGPAIVWIRVPNTSKRALLDWFSRMLPELAVALERGETLVEVM